ncbi:hypothetical protein [Jannaschia sp. W003]|nr:hypothetical protein [Jannaschia sp. W003]UWQ20986.1 hypothetical protein K3554_13565 [Jannaschia sp. W003]
MTNLVAATLAVLLLCCVAADGLWADWALAEFAGRQMIRLTEWMAFWR